MTEGLTRTTSPPSDTTTCFRWASRPTCAKWFATCFAPSAQSCTDTTVMSAPSPTRISTFSASSASPVLSRITTPRAKRAMSMIVCAPRAAGPSALRVTVAVDGSSPLSRTSSASWNDDQAFAAALSSGMPPVPMRSSSRPTQEICGAAGGRRTDLVARAVQLAVDQVRQRRDRRELPGRLAPGHRRERGDVGRGEPLVAGLHRDVSVPGGRVRDDRGPCPRAGDHLDRVPLRGVRAVGRQRVDGVGLNCAVEILSAT